MQINVSRKVITYHEEAEKLVKAMSEEEQNAYYRLCGKYYYRPYDMYQVDFEIFSEGMKPTALEPWHDMF